MGSSSGINEYNGKIRFVRLVRILRHVWNDGILHIWICFITFFFTLCFFASLHVYALPENQEEEIRASDLYASAAVLMDGDTGRVLFAKHGRDPLPMASTTKILTCILALEKGNLSDVVETGADAASQPEVRLGMREGQRFRLQDLLYSLMLESHNDSASAIASHIGGSVGGFAELMNQKAAEIGCRDTYFITPNGLDASDEKGVHHTTAEDLARIMRYCMMESEQKDEFLEITRTPVYTFSDCEGTAAWTCRNHNAFLNMMEGALTGKTGFTADAGYCYVGALRQDGRTYIAALLACGWPNNKGYKWSDMRKLMQYGLDHYRYRQVDTEDMSFPVWVENGEQEGFPSKEAVKITAAAEAAPFQVLLKDGEDVKRECSVPEIIQAPVYQGDLLGSVSFSIDGILLQEYPVTAQETVEERTLRSCLNYVFHSYLLAG